MAPTRPLSLNKSNGSELPNADVLSLFRQTTCSASASIHYNTLKVRKIYSYSESRKFVKTRIVHHLLLLSNSVQTAYRETGVSNRSKSFAKIIYQSFYSRMDVLSLFRQTTCSESASIHFNTLKIRKIYSYSESRKFVKTRIVHPLLLLLLLLLLFNSVQTAYRKTGVSNRSNSFTKIIYTGVYMILDAQNLHTFSQSRQTPALQPYKC